MDLMKDKRTMTGFCHPPTDDGQKPLNSSSDRTTAPSSKLKKPPHLRSCPMPWLPPPMDQGSDSGSCLRQEYSWVLCLTDHNPVPIQCLSFLWLPQWKLSGAGKAPDPATGGRSWKIRVVTIKVPVLWGLLESENTKWTNLISLKHLNGGSFFCFLWFLPPAHTYTLVHPSLAVWIRKPRGLPVIQQYLAKASWSMMCHILVRVLETLWKMSPLSRYNIIK